jgi:predicted kinase
VNEEPVVVCNNTNTKGYEIAPYYRIAEAYGYDVEIIWVIRSPAACKASNEHGVPDNVIDAMISGVESLPPWWKVRLVLSNR